MVELARMLIAWIVPFDCDRLPDPYGVDACLCPVKFANGRAVDFDFSPN